MDNARTILSGMKNPQGKRILDVGCGPGWLAKLIGEKGGIYVGVDLSPTFCQLTLIQTKYCKMDGAVVCADAENLPFKDQAFEYAFSCESMHHLPEPYKAIREALRVSRSFTLGDEPAKLPKPLEILTVNVLKRGFGEAEPSGVESFRFDAESLKLSLEQKGYIVTVKRQWTYVPKMFSHHENNRFIATTYLVLYSVLTRFFTAFSHSLTIHAQR
ncbi:MAG: class I SAM-dependent methyltransferase [Candidatus Bathyarchaeia archaeon]